jgi:hypothetical protein
MFCFVWSASDRLGCRILIAGIRNLGHRPCPRCYIEKEEIHLLGQQSDRAQRKGRPRRWDSALEYNVNRAREHIYAGHKQVTSKAVEDLLFKESLVPTMVVHS